MAEKHFRNAATRGHVGAMLKLAEYTEHGLGGLTANPTKALDWYQRAADQGDEKAQQEVQRLRSSLDGKAPTTMPAPEPTPAAEKPEEKPKGGFFKKFFK